MGALIGALSAYVGSLGVLFPILLLIITQGVAALGNYLVYGFLQSCSSDFTKANLIKTDSKDWLRNIKTTPANLMKLQI